MNEQFPPIIGLGPVENRVKKLWGTEYWLANHEKYCVKLLMIEPGFMCSKHKHKIKDETFFVVAGEVILEFNDPCKGGIMLPYNMNSERRMKACDSQRIMPDEWHRFRAANENEACILEVSTTHDDADVERIEESMSIAEYEHRCKPDFEISAGGICIPKSWD
jgi:mannose-6-phosphate isomerase-like protein (cupin superfamily)